MPFRSHIASHIGMPTIAPARLQTKEVVVYRMTVFVGALAAVAHPAAVAGLAHPARLGMGVDPGTLSRNDPCWCGSGKKYKKCHGR
jgi:uncharacterized protein YecA (UPF0149 family)